MTELKHLATGGRLKFLARDTVVYGLGGAINKALGLITFPLLARTFTVCLLYTSPSPRDLSTSRMPSSA